MKSIFSKSGQGYGCETANSAMWQVAVSYIEDNVYFDKDLEVSTFEVNIRASFAKSAKT